jgi:flagellar hook-length control protein FliK
MEASEAKPTTGNAPVSTETAANLGALATPSAHIATASAETAATLGALSAPPAHAAPAGPQAAHPPAHQPAPTDTLPVAGLAVEIAAQARSGKNHFEIRLDPPELGRIDVRIEVDKDGQVTSHLRVERAETLDLLRRDAPALERALQQAGLKTSDGGLQFSLRDQAFSHRDQDRDMPAAARIVVSEDMLVPVEIQRNYGRLAGLGGGVDIQV